MSWLLVAFLACAVAAVAGAEWPRLSERLGLETRAKRSRARRKRALTVVRDPELTDQPDPRAAREFAASVERDLAQLPTTDEQGRAKRQRPPRR